MTARIYCLRDHDFDPVTLVCTRCGEVGQPVPLSFLEPEDSMRDVTPQ